MSNFVKSVSLIKTVYKIEDLKEFSHNFDFLIMGRSNVGKSSFINCIVNRKNFAYVSKEPGRTISMNFYLINNLFCLVDLPGYGYSKTSNLLKQSWNNLLNYYFLNVKTKKYVFLLHDIRREFDNLDFEIIYFLSQFKIPIYYVITKIDKESKNKVILRKNHFLKILNIYEENLILFSSLKKIGIENIENIFKNIIFDKN